MSFFTGYTYFFINIACSQNSNYLSNQTKIHITENIGYKNGLILFKDDNSSDIIAFDENGFKNYRNSPNGYKPLFVNNNCEIYGNERQVIIIKGKDEKKIILPNVPTRLVACKNCDTVYYYTNEIYYDSIKDVHNIPEYDNQPLQVFIINGNNSIKGIDVHHQDFWYTDKGILFVIMEGIYNPDPENAELMDVKHYLNYNKSSLDNSKNILLDSLYNYDYYVFRIVSNDGDFWIKRLDDSITFIKSTFCEQKKTVNDNRIYFFYNWKPVFFTNPFYLWEKNYEIMDYDIRQICK